MATDTILIWGIISIAGIVVGTYLVHGAWSAIGAWKIRRAGPRPLGPARHVLWRDPGDVAGLDLRHGPGGQSTRPVPPFRFLEEHHAGTNPCVSVIDARERRWRVKWGNEVNSETFGVRLAWACGYFAEITHFVPEGVIEGAPELQRATGCLDGSGRFTDARFELDDPAVRKLFEEHSWSWNDNPFIGSRELHGLKILSMLLSNWDTKDQRDVARGSNTAIFEHTVRRRCEARHLIIDWGGAMGRWGNALTRARWDPAGFEAQTPDFITGVQDGVVKFGYTGQRTEDIAVGITPADARWLARYLGRITDDQIDEGLRASGASEDERDRFRRAIRERIRQLVRAGDATD